MPIEPMPIEVVWWDGHGSWCMSIVEFLLDGFFHCGRNRRVQNNGAIFVVKADQNKTHGSVREFYEATKHLQWMLLIVTANEDGDSDMAKFAPLNLKFKRWLQAPHKWQECDKALPWGWTPGCMIEAHGPKLWDWSFAGQITHSRREGFVKVARTMDDHQRMLVTSQGFSQGISQDMYYKMLAATKVAPCPSGPITVDSMRVCEALQLGAIPFLDSASPTGYYPEYWERVFGKLHPLPQVDEWSAFPKLLDGYLRSYDHLSQFVTGWWGAYKSGLKRSLLEDLYQLGAV